MITERQTKIMTLAGDAISASNPFRKGKISHLRYTLSSLFSKGKRNGLSENELERMVDNATLLKAHIAASRELQEKHREKIDALYEKLRTHLESKPNHGYAASLTEKDNNRKDVRATTDHHLEFNDLVPYLQRKGINCDEVLESITRLKSTHSRLVEVHQKRLREEFDSKSQ